MSNPKVKVGDAIEIDYIDDYYSKDSYPGRVGLVTSIDDMGQLHGTWGGLGIVPECDKYHIVDINTLF